MELFFYLGCGAGYMTVGIFRKSKNCTFNIVNFTLHGGLQFKENIDFKFNWDGFTYM